MSEHYQHKKYARVETSNGYDGLALRTGVKNVFDRHHIFKDAGHSVNSIASNQQYVSNWTQSTATASNMWQNNIATATDISQKCDRCGNVYKNQLALEKHLPSCITVTLSSDEEDATDHERRNGNEAHRYPKDYEESVVISDEEKECRKEARSHHIKSAFHTVLKPEPRPALEGLAAGIYDSTKSNGTVTEPITSYSSGAPSSYYSAGAPTATALVSPTSNRVSTIQYAPPALSSQRSVIRVNGQEYNQPSIPPAGMSSSNPVISGASRSTSQVSSSTSSEASPYPRISTGIIASQIQAYQKAPEPSLQYYKSSTPNGYNSVPHTPSPASTPGAYDISSSMSQYANQLPRVAYQQIPSQTVYQRTAPTPFSQQHNSSAYQNGFPPVSYSAFRTSAYQNIAPAPKQNSTETITMQDASGTLRRIAVPQVPTMQTPAAPYTVIGNSSYIVSSSPSVIQSSYVSSTAPIYQQKPGLATLHPVQHAPSNIYPVQQPQIASSAAIYPVQHQPVIKIQNSSYPTSAYHTQPTVQPTNFRGLQTYQAQPTIQSTGISSLPALPPQVMYQNHSHQQIPVSRVFFYQNSYASCPSQTTIQPVPYGQGMTLNPANAAHAIQRNPYLVVNKNAHRSLNLTPLPQLDLTRSFNYSVPHGSSVPSSQVQYASINGSQAQATASVQYPTMKLFSGSNSAVLLPVVNGHVPVASAYQYQSQQQPQYGNRSLSSLTSLVQQQQHPNPYQPDQKPVIHTHDRNCLCKACFEAKMEHRIKMELQRPNEPQHLQPRPPTSDSLQRQCAPTILKAAQKRRMVDILPHPSKYVKVHRTVELQKVPLRVLPTHSESTVVVDPDSGFSDTSYSSKDSPPQLAVRGQVLTSQQSNICSSSVIRMPPKVQRKQAFPKPPRKQVWNPINGAFELSGPVPKYKRVSRKSAQEKPPKVPKISQRKRKERVPVEPVSKTFRLTRKSTNGTTYVIKEVREKKNAENENRSLGELMKCIRIKRGKKTGDTVLPLNDVVITPVIQVCPILPSAEVVLPKEHGPLVVLDDKKVDVEAGCLTGENRADKEKLEMEAVATETTNQTPGAVVDNSDDLNPDAMIIQASEITSGSLSAGAVQVKIEAWAEGAQEFKSDVASENVEAEVLSGSATVDAQVQEPAAPVVEIKVEPENAESELLPAPTTVDVQVLESPAAAVEIKVEPEDTVSESKVEVAEMATEEFVTTSKDVKTEPLQTEVEEAIINSEEAPCEPNDVNNGERLAEIEASEAVMVVNAEIVEVVHQPEADKMKLEAGHPERAEIAEVKSEVLEARTDDIIATQIIDCVKPAVKNTHRVVFMFEIKVDNEVRYFSADVHSLWDQIVQLAEGRKCNRLLPPLYCPAAEIAVPCDKTYADVMDQSEMMHEALQYILQQVPDNRRHRVNRGKKRKAIELIVLDDGMAEKEDEHGALGGSARLTMYRRTREFDMFAWLGLRTECKVKGYEVTRPSDELRIHNGLRRARREKKNSWQLVVRHSPIQGRGVFTTAEIPEGEDVIEYTGELIRPMLCDKREKLYESKGYGCYMFKIDDEEVVDATLRGNAARFINHSCDPNCKSRIVEINGRKRIFISTIRHIFPEEELSYDYKFAKESKDKKIACSCGASKCRKFLN